jgi:hypothetical protein
MMEPTNEDVSIMRFGVDDDDWMASEVFWAGQYRV